MIVYELEDLQVLSTAKVPSLRHQKTWILVYYRFTTNIFIIIVVFNFSLSFCLARAGVIAAVRFKHKNALLLRDGCAGQIHASNAITIYNKSVGRSQLHGKSSAGCSMTESYNDLGHGHDGLHRLVESDDFKMRKYDDPEGAYYAALKKFLKEYLEPASFDNYWKFICCFEPYILKAISPVVIKSAVKASGFASDNKIDTAKILGFNPQFAMMDVVAAQALVYRIENELVPYFAAHKQIPEAIFDALLGEHPDIILTEREGRPLNELVTNRQRFIIDNSDEYQEILDAREAVKIAAADEVTRRRLEREERNAVLPPKYRRCSGTLDCELIIAITTPTERKINELTWKKCSGKGCKAWACPEHMHQLQSHELRCQKWCT